MSGPPSENVGVRTLRRWLTEDPEFQADYAAARKAAFEASMSRMQVLEAKDHPTVRLGAARTLVEMGMHQHDAETIVRKLDEIEAVQRKGR
ncbi:MAG: hypothetical protein DMF90_28565 [Acidobacteria bacterium]|nr:MAG: hypothetical protein DMF90_28565 [Acidobacteriota bacterium]